MPAVTNGAELVRKLAATGTGDNKLAVARKCLERIHAEEDRVATSDEVIAALESESEIVSALTLEKARQIAATGTFRATSSVELSIEEKLLRKPAKEAANA